MDPSSPCPKLIIVEGNISAGKSTLCRTLAEELGYTLYLEPTVENPFLEKYYKDPKAYALPMQCWLLKQRFVTYVSALRYILDEGSSTSGIILDRSIFSDIVFAEKNFVDGNFSRAGYDYYLELRNKMLSSLPSPHVVLYLDASPEVCHERIHGLRKRDCEDGIPLAYLAGLDECYRNFLSSMPSTGARVLNFGWDTFGDVDGVAAKIRDVPTVTLGEWASDMGILTELVSSPECVKERMTMDVVIDEARGSEVEVADPEYVTSSESISVIKAHDRSREASATHEADPTCGVETASAGSGSAASEAISDSVCEDADAAAEVEVEPEAAAEADAEAEAPRVSRKPGVVDALRIIMSA